VLPAAPQASPLHAPARMPQEFDVFLVSWTLLWLASWIFYSKASYQTKKSVHPFLIVAFTIIFLGFTEWIMHGNVPLFFVAAVIVIMFLNYRLTQFCSSCSATVRSRGLTRPRFCPKCGAPLEEGLPGDR
jgi:hypothetical protein